MVDITRGYGLTVISSADAPFRVLFDGASIHRRLCLPGNLRICHCFTGKAHSRLVPYFDDALLLFWVP